MSFATEIKREILKSTPEGQAQCLALLCGTLRTGGILSPDSVSFTSENEGVAAYLIELTEKCFGIGMTLTEAVRDPKHGRDKLTFSLSGAAAERLYLEAKSPNLGEQSCALAYLKGAFLGGGSCTLPRGGAKTGYHLEFVFSERSDAEFFSEFLDRFQLVGGIVPRGDKNIVYCKSREGIGDFLSVIGATGSLKTLEKTAAARDESNNRNRLENCTAGNVDRSLTASAEQIRFLRMLERDGKLNALSSPLKETALARLQNPTFTYSELAALLGVSKSCLQHRLNKIMSLRGENK